MSDPSSWARIKQVNIECLRASLGFGFAWLFWTAASSEAFLFYLMAVMCAVAGAKRACIALWHMLGLLMSLRSWNRFARRGRAPKSDRMAQSDDLKKRGLLK